MPEMIAPAALHDLRARGARHALLDVRERGEFSFGQIPWATPLPRGLLELRVPALVPRPDVPIVVYCDDGRRSALAAGTLEAMGYRAVAVLAGGLAAWRSAGYETIDGWGVPGKEYGEKVAVLEEIPQLPPAEVVARQAQGQPFVIVDTRTAEEYARAHLPGAYSVPGGQLPLAIHALAPDPATPILTHCAGRTRSILGAQTLRRLGYRNVFALENGTMAWQMAGLPLEQGMVRPAPAPPSEAARQAAEAFAARVAQEDGLRRIGVPELLALREGATLHYLIDVRLADEYLAGHIPGAATCPGGQLALMSETLIAVRDATIVTCCDGRVRATLAASLLKRMGYPDVRILDGGLAAWRSAGLAVESGGPCPEVFGLADARQRVPVVTVAELAAVLAQAQPPLVLDVRASSDFVLGHIAGSRWLARGKLELQAAATIPRPTSRVVVVCDDGVRSTLAAATLQALGYRDVRVLDGGLDAWTAAGQPLVEGLDGADVSLAEAKADADVVKRRGLLERNRQDMERYLAWEIALGAKYEHVKHGHAQP